MNTEIDNRDLNTSCNITFPNSLRRRFKSYSKAQKRHFLQSRDRQISGLKKDKLYTDFLGTLAKKYGSFKDVYPVCDDETYPFYYYEYMVIDDSLMPTSSEYDFHILVLDIIDVTYQ